VPCSRHADSVFVRRKGRIAIVPSRGGRGDETLLLRDVGEHLFIMQGRWFLVSRRRKKGRSSFCIEMVKSPKRAPVRFLEGGKEGKKKRRTIFSLSAEREGRDVCSTHKDTRPAAHVTLAREEEEELYLKN